MEEVLGMFCEVSFFARCDRGFRLAWLSSFSASLYPYCGEQVQLDTAEDHQLRCDVGMPIR